MNKLLKNFKMKKSSIVKNFSFIILQKSETLTKNNPKMMIFLKNTHLNRVISQGMNSFHINHHGTVQKSVSNW